MTQSNAHPGEALLPATQADRDAATELVSRLRGYGVKLPSDGHHAIQAFARYRLRSLEKPLPADALDGGSSAFRASPAANEPGAYGIGSSLWPGVGKVLEEQSELGTVLGKLMGSAGDRHHWSGDLLRMMQDEIADVRAALDFVEEANPALNEGRPEHGFHLTDGSEYISRRHEWKLSLFRSWQRNDPPELWPQPEQYGLPPRTTASDAAPQDAAQGEGGEKP